MTLLAVYSKKWCTHSFLTCGAIPALDDGANPAPPILMFNVCAYVMFCCEY